MIIVAPFSNDALRDWPRAYFRELIEKLAQQYQMPIMLVGAPEQRQPINLIMRGLPAPRISNMAGRWSWRETLGQIERARLVIANNSGIAHLGAQAGVATLCLFAASHDPYEWRARGPHVTTLYARTDCAPCGMSGLDGCRNGHACMMAIRPDLVLETVSRILDATPAEVG